MVLNYLRFALICLTSFWTVLPCIALNYLEFIWLYPEFPWINLNHKELLSIFFNIWMKLSYPDSPQINLHYIQLNHNYNKLPWIPENCSELLWVVWYGCDGIALDGCEWMKLYGIGICVLDVIELYWMVLNCIGWYWIVLGGVVWHGKVGMVLDVMEVGWDGIEWFELIWNGIVG